MYASLTVFRFSQVYSKLVKVFPSVRIAYTVLRYTERIGWKFPFRDAIRGLLAPGDLDLGVVPIV